MQILKKSWYWLFVLIALFIVVCPAMMQAATQEEPQSVPELIAGETTLQAAFPDKEFRLWVKENVLDGKTDYDTDTEVLTQVGIEKIFNYQNPMNISGKNIHSLEGIEHFVSLEELDGSNNPIFHVDFEGVPHLKKIDLSNCDSLINCGSNGSDIVEVDLTDCFSLKDINFWNCQSLEKLNFSGSNNLENITCTYSRVKELNVSECQKLKTLCCDNYLYTNESFLTFLDVSQCPELKELSCAHNLLKEIDLSNCTKLEKLDCGMNQLKNLDLSGCSLLKELNCSNNQLENIDVSGCDSLETIVCNKNNLNILDVSNSSELKNLRCDNNKLNSLSVSDCQSLVALDCGYNSISDLDLTNNEKLKDLVIEHNPISSVKWPGNDWKKSLVEKMWFNNTEIDSVNLAGFSNLQSLGATHFENLDSDKLIEVSISGEREWNEPGLELSVDDPNDFFVDGESENYIVSLRWDGFKYQFKFQDKWYKADREIEGNGILSNQSVLVLGATTDDIVDVDNGIYKKGDIRVTGDMEIYTPTGLIVLNKGGEALVRNGDILILKGAFNTEILEPKNTSTDVVLSSRWIASVAPSQLMTIDTISYTAEIPGGSVITNLDTQEKTTVPKNGKAVMDIRDSSYTIEGGEAELHDVVINETDNGTVTASPNSAAVGDTVTLTVQPAEGYKLDKLTATAGRENVQLTKESDTTYTFQMPDADVAVSAQFVKKDNGGTGGGGGGIIIPPSYDVTISDCIHGEVSASAGSALDGKEVTLTVTPDDGYVLDTLAVVDADGDKVDVTKKNDTTYTFKMPKSDVTVTATFKADGKPEPALPFTDVAEDAWYYPAVSYVYDHGMMNGMTENTFEPQTTLSRAMMAATLYKLEGQPAAADGSFTDVDANAWYADAVNWAAANGIVSGYGNDTFGPQDPVTREQMAAILYRYAEFKGMDVSAQGDLSQFTDADLVHDWAKDVMSWAVGAEIINGMGDGTVNPQGTATRAEVATILMNFCEKVMAE